MNNSIFPLERPTAPRPKALPVLVEGISPALKRLARWVCWRYAERGGKWTKLPLQPNGRPASSTDPATWAELSAVLEAYRTGRLDGIGIALGGDMGKGLVLACIDLDHIDDTPERKQRAEVILAEFAGAHAETSPSGDGVHILGLARPLSSGIARDGVEIYTGGRYVTVTGHTLEGVQPAAKLPDLTVQIASLAQRVGGQTTPHEVPNTSSFGLGDVPSYIGRAPANVNRELRIEPDLLQLRSALQAIPPEAWQGREPWRNRLCAPLAHAATVWPEMRDDLRRLLHKISSRTGAFASRTFPGGYDAGANDREFDGAMTDTERRILEGRPVATVATIFDRARQHGWAGVEVEGVGPDELESPAAAPPAPKSGLLTSSFLSPVRFDAPHLTAVPWLAPGVLIRGDITVLAAQGASGKTALALNLGVAAAAGRSNLGPLAIKTRAGGLRVAMVSAEEDAGRIGLLVAAACNAQQLTPEERDAVATNFLIHDACRSGLRLGAPAPGSRVPIAPEDGDNGLEMMRSGLAGVDLLVLDNLAALFALPSENDNGAVTILMRRLAKLAREIGCAALLLHHAPKMNREAAAGQRGEVTLVRGGGAITNSARVVLTITAPPAAEATTLALRCVNAEGVRRLEHGKINDAQPMKPCQFAIRSTLVRLGDGSDQAVRSIAFLPDTDDGAVSNAVLRSILRLLDQGAPDGLPFAASYRSPRYGGGAVAELLRVHVPGAADSTLRMTAKNIIAELLARGWAEEREVVLPHQGAGKGGGKLGRIFVVNWSATGWSEGGADDPA